MTMTIAVTEKGTEMRLIDADALLGAISVHLERIEQEIDDAPTIDPGSLIEKQVYLDAEKVAKIVKDKLVSADAIYIDGPMIEYAPERQGRWDEEWLASTSDSVAGYRVWQCSECHNVSTWQTNYCPNCGAKMDIADFGKDNVG